MRSFSQSKENKDRRAPKDGPLRAFLLKTALPVVAIGGIIYGINTTVLANPGGDYLGVCKGLGRLFLAVEQNGTQLHGRLVLPTGTLLQLQSGKFNGNQVELTFSAEPIQVRGKTLPLPVSFVGTFESDKLTGTLTKGTEQYAVRLQRTNTGTLLKRIWWQR